MISAPPATRIDRPPGQGWDRRYAAEGRVGIMLHYDGSGSDAGAVAWFRDPRARLAGYHWLVLDGGRTVQLTPYEGRPYHAGVCRPSAAFVQRGGYGNANRALIGISIAATIGERATAPQVESVARLCRYVFERERWPLAETWRITGHEDEAWPRGRKIDPTGSDPERPVLSVTGVRDLVRQLGVTA